MASRAMIVDDERLARIQMRSLLKQHPEVEVVSEADTLSAAIQQAQEHSLDLVFLDIQLFGESGFDLVGHLKPKTKIIFVTAFDQHAIRAFELNAVDYLLKPVEPQRLANALARLSEGAATKPAGELPALRYSDHLFLSDTHGASFVKLAKVVCIVAEGAYSKVFTCDGRSYMVLRRMKNWEGCLPSANFARIHRNAIVNLSYIDRMEPLANYGYKVSLKNLKQPVMMSRRYALTLKKNNRWG